MKTQGKSGLKLARLPPCSALPIAPLPSISEIPFLDSCVPAFLIKQRFLVRRPGNGRLSFCCRW